MIAKYLIGGSSNRPLLSNFANVSGIEIADVEIDKFPNSEKRIFITTDISGSVVFLLQSTSAPADEHRIETVLIADAAKRMNAKKIRH